MRKVGFSSPRARHRSAPSGPPPNRSISGENASKSVLTATRASARAPLGGKPISVGISAQGRRGPTCSVMVPRARIGDPTGEPIVISWAYHPKALPMAVPNSILLESAKAGMDVRLAHPEGWELDPDVMRVAHESAARAGGKVTVHNDLESALPGARVVYAKSWGSIRNYRYPDEEARLKAPLRSAWRIGMRHLEAASSDAFFMHCLPVRRGVVVDDEVLDSPRNAAYDEAENRLHVQKALLMRLISNR